MSNTPSISQAPSPPGPGTGPLHRARRPPELSIFLVLLGIALFFEAAGWLTVGQSFCSTLSGCRSSCCRWR